MFSILHEFTWFDFVNSIPGAALFYCFRFSFFSSLTTSNPQMFEPPNVSRAAMIPQSHSPHLRWIVNMEGNVTYPYLSTVPRFHTDLFGEETYHQFSHAVFQRFLTRMARKMNHTWTFWSRSWEDTLVFTSQPWMWLTIQLSSDGFMNK